MIGIAIGEPNAKRATAVGDAMLERGVMVTTPGAHTVRLLLPYGAGRAELQLVWDTLEQALAATA
jgi:4-aminobutyrate aminotransferase-like enzyme